MLIQKTVKIGFDKTVTGWEKCPVLTSLFVSVMFVYCNKIRIT